MIGTEWIACRRSWIPFALRSALSSLLVLGGACGPSHDVSGDQDQALVVFAASSLQFALPELVARYSAVSDQSVQTVLGSSGSLATQIEHGAPADVFLSADGPSMDRLARSGRLVSGSRRSIAIGRLALVWGEGVPPPAELGDLVDSAFRVISIANPEVAPYGRAAREAMTAVGVWEQLRPRLIVAEAAAQTVQTIRTGNADAGLVALALIVPSSVLPFIVIDAELHSPLGQEGAAIDGGRSPDAARDFLDLLLSDEARIILTRHGFESPALDGP